MLDRDVDLVGGGHLRHLRPVSRLDGYSPAATASLATTAGSASAVNPVSPRPASVQPSDDTLEHPFGLAQRGSARLGHEDGQLAGAQDVAIEGHVDAVAAVERSIDVGVDPHARSYRRSPPDRDCAHRRPRRPRTRRRRASTAILRGVPHPSPEGELSGVLRPPCASIQTTPSRPGRAARPRIAPRWAQQQPPRTSGSAGRLRICAATWSSSELLARSPLPRGTAAGAMPRPPSSRPLAPKAGVPARALPRTRDRSCGTDTRCRSRRRSASGNPGSAHAEALTAQSPASAGANDGASTAQSSPCQRWNTRHALSPPKPNEFETPISTCSWRASFGM